MSFKRTREEYEYESTTGRRQLKRKLYHNNDTKGDSSKLNDDTDDTKTELTCPLPSDHMECDNIDYGEDDDDDGDDETDPEMIIPYLKRFEESYQNSLSNYTSRLDKLELSEALKCTNDLFMVAIDHYQKQNDSFHHETSIDLSGVMNIRREFDMLLSNNLIINVNHVNDDVSSPQMITQIEETVKLSVNCCLMHVNLNEHLSKSDDKLQKVIVFMKQIESIISDNMKQIYLSYENLLQELIMIEYRLGVIIEMFYHMTDVEPHQFLPSLPYIQNVPDLIGYINSLYDEENDLNLTDESSNERIQMIVNHFRLMHKRIRDAMDGLHALSCIIMEKKSEVIGRVHTFYKKAEQILFSQPSFMHYSKDFTNRSV